MIHHASLASWFLLPLTLVLSASTAACANLTGGDDGESEVAICYGPPGPDPRLNAVAFSELDLPSTESFIQTSAETIILQVGVNGLSCENPAGVSGAYTWSFSVRVPPAYQHPGTFVVGTDVNGVRGATSACYEASAQGDCAESDGGSIAGSLTIVEIDATHVSFTISGANDSLEHFVVDGTYDAARCGQ